MLEKESNILKEIAGKLASDKRLLKIVAYGSRVRGDNRGDSDMDVLVVVDKKDRAIKEKIIEIFYSYELMTDISFSTVMLSLEELRFNEKLGSPFIKSINEEGIVFYDSDFGRKEDAFKIPS